MTRLNAGYKQQHISSLLGHTSNKLLSLWENEKTMPNGTSLIMLCILYRSTPKELYPEYYQSVTQRIFNDTQ